MKSVASAGLALAGQSGQKVVAQAGRKKTIVDSQVHLWKAESADWPWVAGATPQMSEPFTIEKLVPAMDSAGVDRAVIVPPSWPGDRNDYGLEAARRYPDRFGVMGRIPLNDPQMAARLPKWREQYGMLGIRVSVAGASEKWLEDGTADWFWPAAEKAGVPVMVLTAGHGPAFARIAERHPGLTLIVDHMGLSAAIVKAGKLQESIDQTVAVAKFPNVSVKLSAGPNYSAEAYPFRDFDQPIRRLFDVYGPQRCYWGSDLTNGFTKATYRQRVTHFTEELGFLSKSDKEWVMGRAILSRLNWV
jgi:predicted TIM-barrel fold metal-dependent hydrolase